MYGIPTPTRGVVDWVYVSSTVLLEVDVRDRFPYISIHDGDVQTAITIRTKNREYSRMVGNWGLLEWRSTYKRDSTDRINLRGYGWFDPGRVDQLGRDIKWHRINDKNVNTVITPNRSPNNDRMLIFLVEAVNSYRSGHYGVRHSYTIWYECRWWMGHLEVKRYIEVDSISRKFYQLTTDGYGSVSIYNRKLSIRVPGRTRKLTKSFSKPSLVDQRQSFISLANDYGYALVYKTDRSRVDESSPARDLSETYLVYYDRWNSIGDVERGFVVCRQPLVLHHQYVLLLMMDWSVVIVDLVNSTSMSVQVDVEVVHLIAYEPPILLFQSNQGIVAHDLRASNTRVVDRTINCPTSECMYQWLPGTTLGQAVVGTLIARGDPAGRPTIRRLMISGIS